MANFQYRSKLLFQDISGERERIYIFDNNFEIKISGPQWLHVSASGGHRIIDEEGNCWYIAPKWYAFTYDLEDDDREHFRF